MIASRKRMLLSGGALLGVGALFTAANFFDIANLNLGGGGGDGGGGIGTGGFSIQVRQYDADGQPTAAWQEANTIAGENITVAGANEITPGDTIEVLMPYRNDSDKLGADINLWLNADPNVTYPATPAGAAQEVKDGLYRDALRFTVLAEDGTTKLVDNVAFADFDSALEALDLTEGVNSLPGTPGYLRPAEEAAFTLQITLVGYDDDNVSASDPGPDGLTNDAINGGVGYVQVHWDAASVVIS
ncbi:hypothetical protein [Cellulomonas hominis]